MIPEIGSPRDVGVTPWPWLAVTSRRSAGRHRDARWRHDEAARRRIARRHVLDEPAVGVEHTQTAGGAQHLARGAPVARLVGAGDDGTPARHRRDAARSRQRAGVARVVDAHQRALPWIAQIEDERAVREPAGGKDAPVAAQLRVHALRAVPRRLDGDRAHDVAVLVEHREEVGVRAVHVLGPHHEPVIVGRWHRARPRPAAPAQRDEQRQRSRDPPPPPAGHGAVSTIGWSGCPIRELHHATRGSDCFCTRRRRSAWQPPREPLVASRSRRAAGSPRSPPPRRKTSGTSPSARGCRGSACRRRGTP